MKKEEKIEKAEAEKKEREKQQKAIDEELILNEKEQLRLELERAEEGGTQEEQKATEGEEIRHNDVIEIPVDDCV